MALLIIMSMFYFRTEVESTAEHEQDFITIATNVFHKPEVSRAIIEARNREIEDLQNQLARARKSTTVDSVKGLISLYTGLPDMSVFETLLFTCNSLGINYWAGWEPQEIERKEQMLLTLMKLRLNLPHADLAYRFGISATQVMVYCITCIYVC